MSAPVAMPPPSNPPDRARRRRSLAARLSVVLAAMVAATVLAYYYWYPSRLGPPQPIAFSHRVHAGDKRISCVFCHEGAMDAQRAGVPPVQTCMLCHDRIIVRHPQIVKLRDYWRRQAPVSWARVNEVPGFVFFDHEMHVRKGIDCGKCHGDVAGMDRVAMPWDLTMGFCVQCHRQQRYSHDCYVCHR